MPGRPASEAGRKSAFVHPALAEPALKLARSGRCELDVTADRGHTSVGKKYEGLAGQRGCCDRADWGGLHGGAHSACFILSLRLFILCDLCQCLNCRSTQPRAPLPEWSRQERSAREPGLPLGFFNTCSSFSFEQRQRPYLRPSAQIRPRRANFTAGPASFPSSFDSLR